jgi:hypothetical protein
LTPAAEIAPPVNPALARSAESGYGYNATPRPAKAGTSLPFKGGQMEAGSTSPGRVSMALAAPTVNGEPSRRGQP